MDEIKRLTPAQRARCNRLIRRLCANYDGGAASNIKRRESLDFRGFFEGEADVGQLSDFGIPKILGGPRPAPDALSRFASQLCQLAAGQRRSPQAHSGVVSVSRPTLVASSSTIAISAFCLATIRSSMSGLFFSAASSSRMRLSQSAANSL